MDVLKVIENRVGIEKKSLQFSLEECLQFAMTYRALLKFKLEGAIMTT